MEENLLDNSSILWSRLEISSSHTITRPNFMAEALSAFTAYGALPLESRTVAPVADLMARCLVDLRHSSEEEKGSVQQVADGHFVMVTTTS
jgi:hypothetical protein